MPAPPVPPTPKIPVVPEGLEVHQVGERVELRWRVKRLLTDGSRMSDWPTVEVYRAFAAKESDVERVFEQQAKIVYTLPPALVDIFLREGTVVFGDALDGATLRAHTGQVAVYGLKAVNDKRQDAGFSNLAATRVYPVPTPIRAVEARTTERGIELSWKAPVGTTSGTPVEAVAGYEIYRSTTGEPKSFVLHGTSASTHYEDTQFQYGQRYFYRVRTLVQFGADTVASEDSAVADVIPRDVFPPPVPQNLIAVAGEGRVDLTWDASTADDLAGYFVYRSTQSGTGYARVNSKATAGQTLADTGPLQAGTMYFYVVTAVDREGNESRFSAEVSAVPLEAR